MNSADIANDMGAMLLSGQIRNSGQIRLARRALSPADPAKRSGA